MSEVDFSDFTMDDARELDYFKRVKVLNARMKWLNSERQKDKRELKAEQNKIYQIKRKFQK